MKSTIKAYTDYDERRNIHYYRNFEIVDQLPEVQEYDDRKIIEIIPLELDCEQGSPEVWNYDYYEIVMCLRNEDDEFDESDSYSEYVAIEKVFEEEETEK